MRAHVNVLSSCAHLCSLEQGQWLDSKLRGENFAVTVNSTHRYVSQVWSRREGVRCLQSDAGEELLNMEYNDHRSGHQWPQRGFAAAFCKDEASGRKGAALRCHAEGFLDKALGVIKKLLELEPQNSGREFIAGYSFHHEKGGIDAMVEEMKRKLKLAGYRPRT
ncbi:hypothetical protein HPP92_001501 [Vanilla planifolia]|uniref:Uncharacterized protein n=1 Tax=Vanilla planifolia TaxID=51239 RepID=A0A835VI17_VANPL|nr:hypothetical protein HPP92_001501 [Vanilla planifolia]